MCCGQKGEFMNPNLIRSGIEDGGLTSLIQDECFVFDFSALSKCSKSSHSNDLVIYCVFFMSTHSFVYSIN